MGMRSLDFGVPKLVVKSVFSEVLITVRVCVCACIYAHTPSYSTDKNFIENTFHNMFWSTEIQGSHTQKINTYFLISTKLRTNF